MQEKHLKPWQGILVLVLCALVIFVISPMFLGNLGLWGTAVGELLILVVAVGVAAACRVELKSVFPVHKPHVLSVVGTLMMWAAAFGTSLICSLLAVYIFPDALSEGAGLGTAIMDNSLIVGMLIVSLTPAVCEEAVFRGAFLNSLKGIKSRWIIVVLVGGIFGAFHGSAVKFLPTAMLGMVMTWIVLESGNMLYSALLHAVNNLLPVLLLFFMKSTYAAMGGMDAVSNVRLPLASVGIYMIFGAGIPFLLYIGQYFIKEGEHGCEEALFGKGKGKILALLITISVLLAVVGFCMILYTILYESDMLTVMM